MQPGTALLGGAQDIDALVAYMAGFKKTASNPGAPAYDPAKPELGKPRINRLSSGNTCPTGSNANPS